MTSIAFSGNTITITKDSKSLRITANNPRQLAHCKQLALDSVASVYHYIKGHV